MKFSRTWLLTMENTINERNIFGDKNIPNIKQQGINGSRKCELVNKKMFVYFKIKILDTLFRTLVMFLTGHIFYCAYY